jgi:hypothetical protein
MPPTDNPPLPALAAVLDTDLPERRPAPPPRHDRVPLTLLGWSALIAKGMIYSPAHGDTAFTVPLFDAFMKRTVT